LAKSILLITINNMNRIIKALSYFLCCVFALSLTACESEHDTPSIQEQGALKIITRNGPTTYFEGAFGPTGFEYELAQQFADFLGVKLDIQVTHNLEHMFNALNKGEAHLAAAGLTVTEDRQQFLDFSPPYLEVQQQVVYRAKTKRPKSVEDLVGHNILVIANSSHSEKLSQLKKQFPELRWRAAADVETTDILDRLSAGEISYSLIDSNELLTHRSLYPDIKAGFDIGEPGKLAWAMPKSSNNRELKKQLEAFFTRIREDGTLEKLQERFYSHIRQIDAVGLLTFNKAVDKRLPEYLPLIKTIAEETDMQWQLLAAISYQESHWKPKAKSPTGVRGMMMLTLPTAKEMGVTNRLDAEQSLRGGAQYFKKVLGKVPQRIGYPDRIWFALAAYNIGFGHLEDTRKITQSQKANPDSWADVKTRLPLLTKSRFYQHTKHGYARGHEALNYVQNIRQFYTVLSLSEQAETRKAPLKNVDQYVPSPLKNGFDAL
jgi:membrane-bound lytic murein transglycosylase F